MRQFGRLQALGLAERSKFWLGHPYILGEHNMPQALNRVKVATKRWLGGHPAIRLPMIRRA